MTAQQAALAAAGVGTILDREWLRTPNTFRVRTTLRSGADFMSLANSLAANPQVRFANPAFRVIGPLASSCNTTLTSIDDAHYAESWGHQAIQIEEAWKVCAGEASTIIAVLDDGVDFHPDLWQEQTPLTIPPKSNASTPQKSAPRGDFLEGTDCTSDCEVTPGVSCNRDCTGLPMSHCDRHGTLVLSVISSTAGNALGTVGVAPGVSILPIRIGHYFFDEPDVNYHRSCYLYFKANGTSLAAPYLAGLAGIIFSMRPDFTAREAEKALIETSDDLGPPGYDETSGHGRPNGQKLVDFLLAYIFYDGFESGSTSAWELVSSEVAEEQRRSRE